ncbi:MAG TPA: hypothetical protein VNR18_14110 [Hyphomicrobiales bacterium]|nr:hypothetical protein [Hyphomicrobiales bacterium]
MSVSLIELRDHALCVRNANGLLAREPGYVCLANDTVVFGDAARLQARLHPRHCFNQFWAQLNLDPLPLKHKQFRHAADLAHRQLDQLTRPLGLDDAVLGVPGSYSREQLAVLLGIARQCAFATVGLVDLALLQAAASPADDCILIDLQLHQTLLTHLRRVEGQLRRERVMAVPATGLVALQDAWINLISDEFIRQSRFDPRRDAEAEQFLVDQLPGWIAASQTHDEVLCEINLKGSVQQARLTFEHFEQRVRGHFLRVAQALDELRNPGTVLHASASQLNLPGLSSHIHGLIALEEDAALRACLQYLPHIRRAPDQLQLITRLPLEGAAARATPAPQPKVPTHVLFDHRAMLLPPGRLSLGKPPPTLASARIVPLGRTAFSGAVTLLRSARGVQLELHTSEPVRYNDAPALNGQMLVVGDRLQLGRDGPSLHLIVVEGA